MSAFSIGDLISGDKKGDLSDLFTKKSLKAEPLYDYSVIPERANRQEQQEEEQEEDVEQNKRKLKKLEKKKRKALEQEAVKTEITKKRKLDKEGVEEPTGTEPSSVQPETDKPAGIDSQQEKQTGIDPEQEKRTVFVGNVPVTIKEKMLKKIFAQFGTIESVRFRCASRPDLKTSKKVAVIKQMFHEERKNINAYIRFSSEEEARKSCSFNGTEVEGHALRVDMSLNSKVHEQNKAIFLGNLDFKTHEDDVRAVFEKCGEIVDIRLVRDSSTGIGKGFGYVNFLSKDSVETALSMNGAQVCGRQVRVSRSLRKPKPNSLAPSQTPSNRGNSSSNHRGGNSSSNQRGGNSSSNQRGGNSSSNHRGGNSSSNYRGGNSSSNYRGNNKSLNNRGNKSFNDDKRTPMRTKGIPTTNMSEGQSVSFKEKFEKKKANFAKRNENKVWKKKVKKEETKAFQGVTTTDKKVVKRERLSKQELKKKYIAKKLMN